MAIITEGEYKGSPTISIKNKEDDKYPFTFGAAKARMIVENFEAIKAFAEKHKNFRRQKSDESFS